jgi:hypothetical protein
LRFDRAARAAASSAYRGFADKPSTRPTPAAPAEVHIRVRREILIRSSSRVRNFVS